MAMPARIAADRPPRPARRRPASFDPRTVAQPAPISSRTKSENPTTPPSLSTVIGLLWEITTRTRRCSVGVSVSSKRRSKPPSPAPTTGSSRQISRPPFIRSKRPSLTRSSRFWSVSAWRTLLLVADAMPPATSSRTSPVSAARHAPIARPASRATPEHQHQRARAREGHRQAGGHHHDRRGQRDQLQPRPRRTQASARHTMIADRQVAAQDVGVEEDPVDPEEAAVDVRLLERRVPPDVARGVLVEADERGDHAARDGRDGQRGQRPRRGPTTQPPGRRAGRTG